MNAFTAEQPSGRPEDLKNTTLSAEVPMPDTSVPERGKPSPSAVPAIGERLSIADLRSIYGNLPDNVIELCKKAERKIIAVVDYSRMYHPMELFKISSEVMAFQSWILKWKMAAESGYRKKRADFIREGSSAAAAEVEAKTSDEYRAHVYLEHLFDLCHETVLLIKKFGSGLENELKQ